LPWDESLIEVRDIFALVENAAGDAVLGLCREYFRLLQVTWVMTIGIGVEVPLQQVLVCREMVVGGQGFAKVGVTVSD
jgi:hypothetical protein